MKSKSLTVVVCIVLIITMCMGLTACNLFSSGKEPQNYTIQYTDDAGLHELTVTEGELYNLEVIPEREGYTFTGLFDAEVGGTQYVSARGSALSAFTDGKSIVLYPQFKANEYTIILDYQGAQVTGSRQITVAYGSSFPELPKNLTLEHKEFSGWYTAENCGGIQVANAYGLIPIVSVLNKDNFDISKDTIYLYAGFEDETFDVICCFEAGMDTEIVKVAYDTPVSQIVTQTRVDGNAPLTWSKSQGGEVFNGKVTGDMVLYAVEYAPVIELDSNGGNAVNPIVARAGSTISLPTPTKDLAKFSYWEDMQGNRYDSATMPDKSISLKAVWQAKIVFDENGGTDVDDISETAGATISLPTPEKEGFIFAGWYTEDKTQYTSTKMPSNGIKLKAGWYKEKQGTVIVYSENNIRRYGVNELTIDNDLTIDFSEYLPEDFSGTVSISANLKIQSNYASLSKPVCFRLVLYTTGGMIDQYKVLDKTFKLIDSDYTEVSYSATIALSGNKLYGATYSYKAGDYDYSSSTNAKGYYVNLSYPDTTNLYL